MNSRTVGIIAGLLGLCVVVGVVLFFKRDRGDVDGRLEVREDRTLDGQLTRLMIDSVDHGFNFKKPANRADWGKSHMDLSRLPTSYYHQRSPVGMVMQKLNGLTERDNQYPLDARLPASLVGLAGPPGTPPWTLLVDRWSEPPFAVLGPGCGTMAAYARPYQWVDFYERNEEIAKLSVPAAGIPKFSFVSDAVGRGALVHMIPGDERAALARQGPEQFYRVLVVETARGHPDYPLAKWLTKEAISLYFTKMAPGGIVCFHISSRSFDMSPLLADVSDSLGLASLRGLDRGSERASPFRHQYTSEWVMVARQPQDLAWLKDVDGDVVWSEPPVSRQPVMTDATLDLIQRARRR